MIISTSHLLVYKKNDWNRQTCLSWTLKQENTCESLPYVINVPCVIDVEQEFMRLKSVQSLKPSQCTPLFMAAFEKRGAGCCIHTHSQWAVLVTLLVERDFGRNACFEIEHMEQIKGIPKGRGKLGYMGYYDRLRIPIIENTAQ